MAGSESPSRLSGMETIGWILLGHAVLLVLLGVSLCRVAKLSGRHERPPNGEVLLWGSMPMTGITLRDALQQQGRGPRDALSARPGDTVERRRAQCSGAPIAKKVRLTGLG